MTFHYWLQRGVDCKRHIGIYVSGRVQVSLKHQLRPRSLTPWLHRMARADRIHTTGYVMMTVKIQRCWTTWRHATNLYDGLRTNALQILYTFSVMRGIHCADPAAVVKKTHVTNLSSYRQNLTTPKLWWLTQRTYKMFCSRNFAVAYKRLIRLCQSGVGNTTTTAVLKMASSTLYTVGVPARSAMDGIRVQFQLMRWWWTATVWTPLMLANREKSQHCLH